MSRLKQNSAEGSRISGIFLSMESELKRFLVRFLARKEDVEDVMQDAYLRAIKAEKTMDIEFPRPFLYKVARNLALTEISKKSNKITSSLEDHEFLDPIDNNSCLEHNASVQQELNEFYEDVLQALPPQCQKVFVLRKVYGYKHKEIAAKLEISVSTVEKHLTKGLKKYELYVTQKQQAREAGQPLAELRMMAKK